MNKRSKRFLKSKKQRQSKKKLRKISQSAGMRSKLRGHNTQRSRYVRPNGSRQPSRLTSRSTKLRSYKSSLLTNLQQSDYRYVQFVEQSELLKSN